MIPPLAPQTVVMELPDFHIPHAEKIDWMVETHGWAIEAVPPRTDVDPPQPGVVYTVGFPEAFNFPDVVLLGLTGSAARGLFDMLADLLRGGTEIPLGVELTGLFDQDLRCIFLPVADDQVRSLMTSAIAWRKGASAPAVQLLWPDRNGFLPTEAGFDQRLVRAQPVIGVWP